MHRAEPRLIETVALGLLQGPVELLPISSSAHVGLLLRRDLAPEARKEVEVALHAGTALALLGRSAPRLALLAAATAPPAVAGFAFERAIESRLGTPRSIAAGLLAGAAAMALADRVPARRGVDEAGVADGAWLGLAQAVALIPGVSRSGATRAVARARGFGRADAAALSREVALPVLAGAAALKGYRLVRRRPSAREMRTLAAGAAAAAVSTSGALRVERARTGDAPLSVWAAYRAALAAAIVATGRNHRRRDRRRRSSAACATIGAR